jgi:hypothetical protein
MIDNRPLRVRKAHDRPRDLNFRATIVSRQLMIKERDVEIPYPNCTHLTAVREMMDNRLLRVRDPQLHASHRCERNDGQLSTACEILGRRKEREQRHNLPDLVAFPPAISNGQ